MDNRKLVCFVLLASAVSVSHADGFFVNAGLGGSNFYPQWRDNTFRGHSSTEALRVGYRWNIGAFSYGLEAGYANLGSSHYDYAHNSGFEHYSERIDGPVLGANLKYALPLGFFISARGGYFRSTDHQVDQADRSVFSAPFGPYVHVTSRKNFSGAGSYVGMGLGYDFNASFGMGFNYDRYRAHVETSYQEVLFGVTPRVDAYTVTAEYRF